MLQEGLQASEIDSRRGCATGKVGEYRGRKSNYGHWDQWRCAMRGIHSQVDHSSGELYRLQRMLRLLPPGLEALPTTQGARLAGPPF